MSSRANSWIKGTDQVNSGYSSSNWSINSKSSISSQLAVGGSDPVVGGHVTGGTQKIGFKLVAYTDDTRSGRVIEKVKF